MNLFLLAELSLAAYYNNFTDLDMLDVKIFDYHPRFTLFHDDGYTCYYAFRGTYSLDDIFHDLESDRQQCNNNTFTDAFVDSYKELENDFLTSLDYFKDSCQTIYLTGHSLGGSMAIIAQDRIPYESTVVTFGSPKTCCNKVKDLGDSQLRVVDLQDPIPYMPNLQGGPFHCTDHILNLESGEYEINSQSTVPKHIFEEILHHRINHYISKLD